MKGPEATKVKEMFSQVASGYDKANTVLSLGIHHLWRKTAVKASAAKQGDHVLDCATGTGDLAIEFKKVVGSSGHVVGTDFCAEMLESAPQKAKLKNLEIDFSIADVTALPFKNAQFDISSISFGIRNVENPVKGLSELARVVKPGGRVVVLEFGQVRIPLISAAYRFYSEKILPQIGGLVTGQKGAYEYLQKSSAAFPDRENFVQLMMSTGQYSQVTYSTLSGGIAYLYIGFVK